MHDLNDLYYFVQVVDLGGFAPAGRALGDPSPNSAGAPARAAELTPRASPGIVRSASCGLMRPVLFVETDVNPDSLVKRAIDATVESAEVNSGNAHLSAHRA